MAKGAWTQKMDQLIAITTQKPIIKGRSKVEWARPHKITLTGTEVSRTLVQNQKRITVT